MLDKSTYFISQTENKNSDAQFTKHVGRANSHLLKVMNLWIILFPPKYKILLYNYTYDIL